MWHVASSKVYKLVIAALICHLFLRRQTTTSLLQGLKYMIITLDIKIIIIKQEMLEPFQITQSELIGQFFGIHWITMLESQIW